MIELDIYIEISGNQCFVGKIEGDSYLNARFSYADDYLEAEYSVPISKSLPLKDKPFSEESTRNFFEGLLPEGFSRKAVANWIKTDENDYISILSVLGRECLGAIKIVEAGTYDNTLIYEKMKLNQVKALAEEGASKSTGILMETHLSLTGASGKVGLYYDKDNDNWYLPKGNAPSTHIVKQSHVRLSDIIVNEQLCMQTAKLLDIEIPDSFIIKVDDNDDTGLLYATKRYDRVFNQNIFVDGLRVPNRLHQEDFAQILGLSSSEKYETEEKGYLKKMFDVVRFYCNNPLEDQYKLWKMICYDYLIGNTDCHIKNFSILYSDSLRGISLAPAYDMVSTRVYGLTKNMSFFIGGKTDIESIKRKDFMSAAANVGLSVKKAMSIFDDMADKFENVLNEASKNLTDNGFKTAEKLKNKIILFGGYS